jgi:hypothetical protein
VLRNRQQKHTANPLGATLKDDTTDNKKQKNDRQNANATQNKKSCNATHKPTQLQHILFYPTAPKVHPPP